MHVPEDIDPGDTQVRQTLINALRLSREARDINLAQVGALLGVSRHSVGSLERRITWQARTLTRYARTIGWRIEWLLHDLVVPDDDDITGLVIAAGDTSTPDRQDRVHWRTVCYDLSHIRRESLSAAVMARRLGVTQSAVFYWEANPEASSVIAAQRHARALGGMLNWRLHQVATPLHAYAPLQQPAA